MSDRISRFQVNGWAVIVTLITVLTIAVIARNSAVEDCRKERPMEASVPAATPAPEPEAPEAKPASNVIPAQAPAREPTREGRKRVQEWIDPITEQKNILICYDVLSIGHGLIRDGACMRSKSGESSVFIEFDSPVGFSPDPNFNYVPTQVMEVRFDLVDGSHVIRKYLVVPSQASRDVAFLAHPDEREDFITTMVKTWRLVARVRNAAGTDSVIKVRLGDMDAPKTRKAPANFDKAV